MIRLSHDEQENIVKKSGWDSKVVPRPVTALSVFITLSKFLKEKEWVKYFENAAYQILAKNDYAGAKSQLLAKENLVL